jgi:hypothetical protein
LAYPSSTRSNFFSEQTSHQQLANRTFLSKQIKRTVRITPRSTDACSWSEASWHGTGRWQGGHVRMGCMNLHQWPGSHRPRHVHSISCFFKKTFWEAEIS